MFAGSVGAVLTARMDLSRLREAYEMAGLEEADLADDPVAQFQQWFAEVEAAGYWEPNAMVLSTVAADGSPSARNVLLKRVDERGFVLFTNSTTHKGGPKRVAWGTGVNLGGGTPHETKIH